MKSRTSRYSATPRRGPFRISSRQLGVADQGSFGKAMKEEASPCPVCGFIVFSGPPGSYDICPVCDWEDDHVQLAHPLMQGGANRESLVEAQIAILKKIPVAVREHDGFKREDCWRPLKEEEMKVRADVPTDGQSYFEATSELPVYYWRSNEKK